MVVKIIYVLVVFCNYLYINCFFDSSSCCTCCKSCRNIGEQVIYVEEMEDLIKDCENNPEWYKKEENNLLSKFKSLMLELKEKFNDFNEAADKISDALQDHKIALPNLRNTCYMNVVLQILSHEKITVSKIIRRAIEIYKNYEDKILDCPITVSFAMLLIVIYNKIPSSDSGYYSDTYEELHRIIYFYLFKETKCNQGVRNSRYNNFRLKDYNDSQEFLTLLFDDIEDENGQYFLDYVKIKEKTDFKCGNCSKKSSSEPVNNSFLFVPVKKANSVTEAISYNLRNENILCNVCRSLLDCSVTILAKDVIIIVLGTLEDGKNYNKKIKKDITSDPIIEINKCKYELKSIIIHSGNVNEGHYNNIIKINDNYYYFQDLEYKILKNIDNIQPYMLLYRKMCG